MPHVKKETALPGTVTAVLPNFNHGHYLAESLGSLLEQSRSFDEIIVIDDCSTDDSVALIEVLAARHPEIKLHVNATNCGIAYNNNLGLKMARGEYVGFYAADDRYAPSMLLHLASALDANPQIPLAGGYDQWMDESGELLKTYRRFSPSKTVSIDGAGYEALSTRFGAFLSGVSSLYRRSELANLGGFDGSLGAYQDAFVRERLASKAGTCFVPAVVGYWRRSPTSYSSVSAKRGDLLAGVLNRMNDTLAEDVAAVVGISPTYADRVIHRCRQQALVGLIESGHVDVPTVRSILPPKMAWLAGIVSVASRHPKAGCMLVSLLLAPLDLIADVRFGRVAGPPSLQ